MIGNYKIVTLCGSTRFKEQFLKVQKRLTQDGCIVINVGLFGHSGDEEVWKPGTKEMLDNMHLRKIDLADEIFVINAKVYCLYDFNVNEKLQIEGAAIKKQVNRRKLKNIIE